MSKVNLWNTISLAQTGKIKLLDSGRELFGTVIKHGVNDKTVTVRVSSRHWNHKYKKALYSNKSKQVHDELNYCVTGDKVIIANCCQLSPTKSYYVKTIVKPFQRSMAPKQDALSSTPPPAEIENSLKVEGNNADDSQLSSSPVVGAETKSVNQQKVGSIKEESVEQRKSKGRGTSDKKQGKGQKGNRSVNKKARNSPTKTKKSDLVV